MLPLKEAEAGGFFSYAAGVAFRIRSQHHIGGLVVDNLPTVHYRTSAGHSPSTIGAEASSVGSITTCLMRSRRQV